MLGCLGLTDALTLVLQLVYAARHRSCRAMPRSVKTVKINPHTLEMWTTVVVESEEREASKSEEREARRGRGNLVQTALMGEVQDYVEPDHAAGELFPGPQPSTTQLSLFESGFKRKSGQMSLFETGFKRRRERAAVCAHL